MSDTYEVRDEYGSVIASAVDADSHHEAAEEAAKDDYDNESFASADYVVKRLSNGEEMAIRVDVDYCPEFYAYTKAKVQP